MNSTRPAPGRGTKPELKNLATVIVGIVLGQFILYGPSLCGSKVLLPLKVLALPNVYLPQSPETARIASENIFLPDAIYLFEPARRFAAAGNPSRALPDVDTLRIWRRTLYRTSVFSICRSAIRH